MLGNERLGILWCLCSCLLLYWSDAEYGQELNEILHCCAHKQLSPSTAPLPMSFLRLANEIHFYLRIFNDSQKTRSLVLNLISKAEQLPAAECFLTASWSLLQNWLWKKKDASTGSNTVAFGRSWMFSLCLPLMELPALRCCVLCPAARSGIGTHVTVWSPLSCLHTQNKGVGV